MPLSYQRLKIINQTNNHSSSIDTSKMNSEEYTRWLYTTDKSIILVSGLDSASCSQCIALLKRLAKIERRTVICTIHQPSALLLEMFDVIYCVANGYCIYSGSVKSLLPHMSSVGADCPAYHNPADFRKWRNICLGTYWNALTRMLIIIHDGNDMLQY